jgi:hypothetical protein
MSTQNYGHRHDDDEKSFLTYEDHLAKERLNFPPTFGYYKDLINQKAPNEYSALNDWFQVSLRNFIFSYLAFKVS